MRSDRFFALSILVLLTVVLGAAEARQPPAADPLLSLIPKDGEINGFVRDGKPVLCYDEESLSEYIDGAAPFYLERGAVAVLFQYYRGSNADEELKIELYRMKDPSAASHLFEEIEKGKPASNDPGLKGLGEGRYLEQALLGVYLLEFYAGSFFIRMEAQGKGPAAKETLLHFGSFLFASLKGIAEKPR
jgi:Family of unknown function (DUF6599)